MKRRTFLLFGASATVSPPLFAAERDPVSRIQAQFEFDALRLLTTTRTRVGSLGPEDLQPTTRAIAAIGAFRRLFEHTRGDISAPSCQALVRELAQAVGAGLLALSPRLARTRPRDLAPPDDEGWLDLALAELQGELAIDSGERAREQVVGVLEKLRRDLSGSALARQLALRQRRMASLISLADERQQEMAVAGDAAQPAANDQPDSLTLGMVVLGLGIVAGAVLVVMSIAVAAPTCPSSGFPLLLLGLALITGGVVGLRRLRASDANPEPGELGDEEHNPAFDDLPEAPLEGWEEPAEE